MSTLNGLRVTKLEAHIPRSGAWIAYLSLDSATLPPLGRTVLTIGDLALVGAVIRTDYDDHPGGGLPMAVVRGGAGWRLPVVRQGRYASSDGVRLSTVLYDLATQAGEPYAAPADTSLGVEYRWEAHTPLAPVHGEDVLAELITRGYLPTWRVDPATGTTRFDTWPSIGAADGRGRVLGRNLARGRRTVGLDVQVAAFLPGSTLEGTTTARLVLQEDARSLRGLVYAAPTASTVSSSTGAAAGGGAAGAGGART